MAEDDSPESEERDDEHELTLEEWHRQRLDELRAAIAANDIDELELLENAFVDLVEDPSDDVIVFGRELVARRPLSDGEWSPKEVTVRAALALAWSKLALARTDAPAENASITRLEYETWLGDLERESGSRASEMFCTMAFELAHDPFCESEIALTFARRALELARTPLDDARARTLIGNELIDLQRFDEAEIVLAAAIRIAPDDRTKWRAQYELAMSAQFGKKHDALLDRLWTPFEDMERKGALAEELCVEFIASELVHHLEAANDPRAIEVQEKVWKAVRALHSGDHPNTLSAQTLLAKVLHHFDHDAKAHTLMVDVERRSRGRSYHEYYLNELARFPDPKLFASR
jgi:tetratricopeptide (TPR) repeat protein